MSSRKGKKGIRDVPMFHDELKKQRGILLTDTAWAAINNAARNTGVSASELIEQWGRQLEDPRR